MCAALLNKAIGSERLICLHVDHGFMRQGESATVVDALRALGVPLEVLDASGSFAAATTQIHGITTKPLAETISPEEKRKIIGDTFMVATQSVCKKKGSTLTLTLNLNLTLTLNQVVTQSMCEKKGLNASDVLLAQVVLTPT